MSDLASVIKDMTGAAESYLSGLSSDLRDKTTLPFDDVIHATRARSGNNTRSASIRRWTTSRCVLARRVERL